MLPFSVLILTLNEEKNLSDCLDSLSPCDDIVLLDSFSSDNTELIANSYDVRFFQRAFDDYASQRNYGLNQVDFKHKWVLMLDADERMTPDLIAEVSAVCSDLDNSKSLYRIRRKDFFMGKWIRRASGYPTWFGRLIKTGLVRVERAVNEEYVTDGEVGVLDNHIIHYPFNKGVKHWLDKHNVYSTMEAEQLIRGGDTTPVFSYLMSSDPVKRRKAIKKIVYKLPGRPLFVFLALYVVRGGLLDGRAGFIFCALRAWYEFMISCKVMEFKSNQVGAKQEID